MRLGSAIGTATIERVQTQKTVVKAFPFLYTGPSITPFWWADELFFSPLKSKKQTSNNLFDGGTSE
jgi:hypothetical protein